MCEIIFLVVFHHATICTAIFLYLQNVYIHVSEFFSKCAHPTVMFVFLNHNFGVPRCFGTCIFSLILSTTIMQRCCTHKQCCSLHYPPTRQRSALFQLKLIFFKKSDIKTVNGTMGSNSICVKLANTTTRQII